MTAPAAWEHSEKMRVLYLEGTRHALAASTQLGNPDATPSVEDLVGDALPQQIHPDLITSTEDALRTLSVAAEYLAVASVDLDPEVFLEPRKFQVLGDPGAESLASVGTGVLTAALVGSDLVVDWSVALPTRSKVEWLVILDGQLGRFSKRGVLVTSDPAPADMTIPGIGLTPGDYTLMVAVTGYALLYQKLVVP